MADFNFFLNRQGVRGNKGEQGEQGYSPRITVKTETAAEYVLNVQNEDGSYDTPNLRGNAIENLGGTYVRFNQDTEQMYTGYADVASTTSQGEVVLSTYDDLTTGGDESEVTTSKDVHDFVEAKISEASVNYVDIDDYTQKMSELDGEISDLDDNKLDFTDLSNTLVAGTNITITPNTQTGKITIAGEPVSRAQADWNQTDTDAPDYIKNKPVIDNELSSTSTNAVQNRLVTNAINLISNEFENYATNKLDNLSTEGEARLHALKAYSDNGEVLTDAEGLEDIIRYAHSSFDLNKFSNYIQGNLNITANGIASGFIQTPTVSNIKITQGIASSNYTISGEFTTPAVIDNSIPLAVACDVGGTVSLLMSLRFNYGATNKYCYLITRNQDGTTTNVDQNHRINLQPLTSHTYKIIVNNGALTFIVDGEICGVNSNFSTLPVLYIVIGAERFNNEPFTGSVDLKQFEITENGVSTFSGNKTGTDTYTINSNTITIPYTESITGSKIAPASSRQDITTVATSLGSANYYTLDEDNGNFTLPQVELYGLIEKAASTVPNGVVQSSTIKSIVSLTQAEYDALATKDSNTFYVITP